MFQVKQDLSMRPVPGSPRYEVRCQVCPAPGYTTDPAPPPAICPHNKNARAAATAAFPGNCSAISYKPGPDPGAGRYTYCIQHLTSTELLTLPEYQPTWDILIILVRNVFARD